MTTSNRPFTSYGIFFQLEREFILQTHLCFDPALALEDRFDLTIRNDYHGPPLPSRYANLALKYDWYKRKRIPRKLQGKIDLRKLNKQILEAWKVADDETRAFCIRFSEVESRKYTKIQISLVKEKISKKKSVTRVPTNAEPFYNGRNIKNEEVSWFDWTFSESAENTASPMNIDRSVSRRSTPTEVDIGDDEIMNIWYSIPTKQDSTTSSPFCQRCYVETQGDHTPSKKELCTGMQFFANEYRVRSLGKITRKTAAARCA